MTDIRLAANGDIDVSGFDSPRLFVAGEELAVIAQRVTIRLRTFLGEWFLDETIGVPYFQEILGGKGVEGAASAIFRSVVENTDGVNSLDEITVTRTDRLLDVRLRASTDAGELVLAFGLSSSFGLPYNDPTALYSGSSYTYGG